MVLLRQGISVCWFSFLAVWVITRRWTKQTAEHPSGQTGHRILLIAAFVLLFRSGPRRRPLAPLTQMVLPNVHVVAATGLTIAVVGLALAVWARLTLGANWSGAVTFKQGHTLTQTGPYRVIRHPIYTAMILLFLGSGIALGTLGALAAIPLAAASLVIKSRLEESLMQQHFPDEYAAYKARTKALVPLVF